MSYPFWIGQMLWLSCWIVFLILLIFLQFMLVWILYITILINFHLWKHVFLLLFNLVGKSTLSCFLCDIFLNSLYLFISILKVGRCFNFNFSRQPTSNRIKQLVSIFSCCFNELSTSNPCSADTAAILHGT